MIQITLIVRGKSKTYQAAGVNLRTSLEAYDLYKEYDKAGGDYSSDLLDRLAGFVCRCFGDAFTMDQLLDGYKGSAFRLYPAMLDAVIAYVHEQVVNFPNPAEMPVTATAKNS